MRTIDEDAAAILGQTQAPAQQQAAPQAAAPQQPTQEQARSIDDDANAIIDYYQPSAEEKTNLVRGSFGQILPQVTDAINNKSPYSPVERYGISTLTPDEQRDFHKSKFKIVEQGQDGKFLVGNDPNSLMRVDPEGMFNDILGDVADVGNMINTVAAQTAGSIIGSPAGPAGIMGGGGAGAALGESVNRYIAHKMGSKATLADDLTKVAVNGLFGAAGEGVFLGLGKAAPIIAKNGTKALNSLINRNPLKKDAAIDAVANTLKIASDVPQGATKTVFKYSPDEVFKPYYTAKESSEPIAKAVVKNIEQHRHNLGVEVAKGRAGFGKSINQPVVDISKNTDSFLNELNQSGYLNPDFSLNKKFITDGNDLKLFDDIMHNLGVKRTKSGNITWDSKISPDRAIKLKQQLSAKFEALSNNGGRIVTGLREGISQNLENFAMKAGNTKFIEANQKFSNFARAMDALKDAGFNIDKPVGLETFMKGFFNKNPGAISAIREIQNQTHLPILSEIEKYAAAQSFSDITPNIMKLGFITGLLGFGHADSPAEKYGFAGLGLLAGSPAGNKMLLKAGFRLAKGIPLKASLPKVFTSSQIPNRVLTSLLSQTGANRIKAGAMQSESSQQSQQR
jgi:hypothetical protein